MEITQSVLENRKAHHLTDSEFRNIDFMLNKFSNFDGLMVEESVAATIYSYWQYFFYQSLFMQYTIHGPTEKHRVNSKGDPFWNKE